jgi:type II secretory pathway predicted ATPase ExeA
MSSTNGPTSLETRLRSIFGFKAIPFSKDLDPDRIFRTDNQETALDRLRYLADRQGIGALFGAPGTGKSTIIRSFLSSLGKTSHSVCYLHDTTCGSTDLYRLIASGFQVEPQFRKSDIMRQLRERLLKLSRGQKIRPVLVIDEAHLLPPAFLDELRLLTNFDEDSRDDLTLLLAGQPQLETHLRLAVNEALAKRITIKVRLRSLHPQEVEEYLAFRLEIAGRTAKLFLPEAVEAIAKASRGIPRLIDRIAEQSLLFALKAKRKEVDAEMVAEAVDEVEP